MSNPLERLIAFFWRSTSDRARFAMHPTQCMGLDPRQNQYVSYFGYQG